MTLKYAASENSELGQQRDYTITFFFFHTSELGWGEERAIERCSLRQNYFSFSSGLK